MNATTYNIFQEVLLSVLTPKCFDNYLIDFNFTDVSCFLVVLKKIFWIILTACSLLVKIPQILKIYRCKSGSGINVLSVTLDLVVITTSMSYNFVLGFPFRAWCGTFSLAVQTLIIAVLVLWFKRAKLQSLLYLVTYLVVFFMMMSGFIPIVILWLLTSKNIGIIVIAKLLQGWTNYRNKNTGQLSAATLIIQMFSSLVRILTLIQETDYSGVILTFVASSLANTFLVFQLVYYWKCDKKKYKKEN
ncbi:mannose-P-dolichol utilization defect 1 protein homolog [Rhynchophorus ferrugineus]|uniref:mannose-P-dolichol utilization defect 1 protein homolog n=1 Tax=Rhynchophorus ferrugineus TaxID=354439 RepID=UPI003FCEE179